MLSPANHAWVKHLRTTPREQWPKWITTSQIQIVPFYDRTGVIYETLGTLNTALAEEILVTIIVILVMVLHLRSSILISALLPLAVLMCFIAMKTFGVDANIVALSGIAIAIGTMVDMGIILCENILRHLDEADPDEDRGHVIFRASNEVASAVLTAVSTTVVSFLPVFTMIAAEGKLFRPLGLHQDLCLGGVSHRGLDHHPAGGPRPDGRKKRAAPDLAKQAPGHSGFRKLSPASLRSSWNLALIIAGGLVTVFISWWAGFLLIALGAYQLLENRLPAGYRAYGPRAASALAVLVVGVLLTEHWLPLGPDKGLAAKSSVRGFVDRRAAWLLSGLSAVALRAPAALVSGEQTALLVSADGDRAVRGLRLAGL